MVALLTPALAAAQQTVTLADVVRSAASDHPSINQAIAAREAATSDRKGMKGRYGPTLSTSASVMLWDSEIVFGPTVVRDQITSEFALTLVQPISPIWAVYQGVKALKYAEESAEIEIQQAKRAQVKEAVQAYFRVLQAGGAATNSKQAVELLEAQALRVQALVEVGSLPPAEALRLDVALAAARQEQFRTETGLELARGALGLAAGAAAGSTLDAAPLQDNTLPPEGDTLEASVQAALSQRNELAQLELTRKQTEIGVLSKKADYIPEVVALAQYSRSSGSGFSGAEAAFVGAQLNWTIFQWGTRKHAIDAAQAVELQVAAGEELARRQIALQVQAAWQQLRTSRGNYGVALAAIVQAEEAYRIEEARYGEGEATTTELLDAQSALLEAQNNENAARYQAWIDYAELLYVMGASLAPFGDSQ